MEKEVRERFERIERNLELAGEQIVEINRAHLELEAAQANSQKRMDRMEAQAEARQAEADARRAWIDEKIANLTILVDRLIERDLGRN